MKFKVFGLSLVAFSLFLSSFEVSAQEVEHKNADVRLGQKALMDGDYKSAVIYLEKALPTEGNDASVLYLLGYSQFQSGDFSKAASTFGKVVALDPTDSNAYYYMAKAKNTLAVTSSSKVTDAKRLELIQGAIIDYSKAITINKTDAKLYQNRGIAYRDLGIASSEGKAANKTVAIDAYNKAITDFEKVLSYDSARKDIQTELQKAKVYRDLLK